MKDAPSHSYRRACLRLVLGLLAIWFSVSFGVVFYFASGLMPTHHYRSVVPRLASGWHSKELSSASSCLLVVYAVMMNRLDAKHGYTEDQ